MAFHLRLTKLDVCYTLFVFIAFLVSPAIAVVDVTIKIRLQEDNPQILFIQFNAANFTKFYECMCNKDAAACNARYQHGGFPFLVVTEVTATPSEKQYHSHFFTCSNDQQKSMMVCNRWSSESNPNNYRSFRINMSNCQSTCVTFVWTNNDQNMTVHNTPTGYEPCTPDSTTAPTKPQTTSPNHTNSTTSDDENDSSTGVIIGVVVAIIIIIVIVAVVVGIIFWRRRHPPPKRQSWPNLEASSNNTTSLNDALNYRYRQHPAAAQEDTSNNNLHYGHDSNFDKGDSNNGGVKHVTHTSTDAVKKSNGTVEKHDYTEVDVTSKRGNNIVMGNISASGYDFADVPEEDKPQAKDGGKRVALVPGNKKKADDNGTGEDSDYSVIDDSENNARQDNRGGSTAAGSTSLYSTAKTDDDFGYSTVKDNNQGKTPANLNNTSKSPDNISTPQNTAYSLAGNTENTISKDSNSTTPHIYSTFHDDNSQPQNPYNVLPDADQDPQSEPPFSKPSSDPTNPNTQPSRYSMANPMLDASFDKTAGNSIEIITLPSSASK